MDSCYVDYHSSPETYFCIGNKFRALNLSRKQFLRRLIRGVWRNYAKEQLQEPLCADPSRLNKLATTPIFSAL
jgi:hypothetical protein